MSEQIETVWEGEPNVELFYETLVKILENKHNVKIKYKVRKKTEEELNSEEMRHRLFVFEDEIKK